MKKNIYLFLSTLGILFPYTQFVPWTNANGLNLKLLLSEMFANQIATGIAIDAMFAGLVIIVFILLDRKKSKVKLFWIPIVGIFLSGIAFALPFYLYLRERINSTK